MSNDYKTDDKISTFHFRFELFYDFIVNSHYVSLKIHTYITFMNIPSERTLYNIIIKSK